MANFDLGIENNIPNSIEQELVLMKQIILQLNLKEKYKDMILWIKSYDNRYNFFILFNAKTPLKLSNIRILIKMIKILNYVEEFITNILLDAL